MRSALIVHSPSTKYYAQMLAASYKNAELHEVKHPPGEGVLNVAHGKDITVAVGGGSVIDTAKIISRDKPCFAIPTTASGAAMTSWAVIWGKGEKISVRTKKPILKRNYYGMTKRLPPETRTYTMYDCLCHAYESLWSINRTSKSQRYAKKALKLVELYLEEHNMDDLIDAGNEAGKAIEITGTNIIHALSYPLTLRGWPHGIACGFFLYPISKYMGYQALKDQPFQLMKGFPIMDKEELIDQALKYTKAHQAVKPINKKILMEIL